MAFILYTIDELTDIRFKVNGLVHKIKSLNLTFLINCIKFYPDSYSRGLSRILDLITAVLIVEPLKQCIIYSRTDDDNYSQLHETVFEIYNKQNIEISNAKLSVNSSRQ